MMTSQASRSQQIEQDAPNPKPIRLKPINSDSRRRFVLKTMMHQMEQGEDVLCQQLKVLCGGEAMALQLAFEETKAALSRRQARQDDLVARRQQDFRALKKAMDHFWSVLKHKNRQREDAARVFKTFGLSKTGARPTGRSQESLSLAARKIIQGAVLAQEKNWPLPLDFPVSGIAVILERIQIDDSDYDAFPRERGILLRELDRLRQQLTVFFKKVRGYIRVLTIEDSLARTRTQIRSFGFEYYEQVETVGSDNESNRNG